MLLLVSHHATCIYLISSPFLLFFFLLCQPLHLIHPALVYLFALCIHNLLDKSLTLLFYLSVKPKASVPAELQCV